jgi:hypothetical protein
MTELRKFEQELVEWENGVWVEKGPVEFVEVPMFKIADKRTGKIMLDQFIETREQADKCIKDGWHFEKRPQLRKHLTPVIAIFAQKVEENITPWD